MDSERKPFDPDALMENGVLHSFGPIDLPEGGRATLWLLEAHEDDYGDEMEWIPRITSCAPGQSPRDLKPLDVASMRRQRKGVLNARTIEDFLRSHGLFQPAVVADLVDLAIGRAKCDDDRVGAYNAFAELAVAWEGSGGSIPSRTQELGYSGHTVKASSRRKTRQALASGHSCGHRVTDSCNATRSRMLVESRLSAKRSRRRTDSTSRNGVTDSCPTLST